MTSECLLPIQSEVIVDAINLYLVVHRLACYPLPWRERQTQTTCSPIHAWDPPLGCRVTEGIECIWGSAIYFISTGMSLVDNDKCKKPVNFKQAWTCNNHTWYCGYSCSLVTCSTLTYLPLTYTSSPPKQVHRTPHTSSPPTQVHPSHKFTTHTSSPLTQVHPVHMITIPKHVSSCHLKCWQIVCSHPQM